MTATTSTTSAPKQQLRLGRTTVLLTLSPVLFLLLIATSSTSVATAQGMPMTRTTQRSTGALPTISQKAPPPPPLSRKEAKRYEAWVTKALSVDGASEDSEARARGFWEKALMVNPRSGQALVALGLEGLGASGSRGQGWAPSFHASQTWALTPRLRMFLMVEPASCSDGETCVKMGMFWDMVANHYPGFIWRFRCSPADIKGLPESLANVTRTPHFMVGQPVFAHWDGEGFVMYEGKKDPAALLAHVKKAVARFQRETRLATPRRPPVPTTLSPLLREHAFAQLDKAFDPNVGALPRRSLQARIVFGQAGRARGARNEFREARRLLSLARAAAPNEPCVGMRLATMMNHFPRSVDDADQLLETFHEEMDAMLAISPAGAARVRVENLPGLASNDPYDHCVGSGFAHSLYAAPTPERNPREALSKHFQVVARGFPELLYVAPGLVEDDDEARKTTTTKTKSSSSPGTCRRVRLGVASGFMNSVSSVSSDFKGVMQRLPRDVFQLIFISLPDSSSRGMSEEGKPPHWYMKPGSDDKYVVLPKEAMQDLVHGQSKAWKAHRAIAALDLDILLHLDLTMSPWTQAVAMARLARVQATSHGHPTTSGISRHIVQHYISWAAAELPDKDEAQAHYTEELQLLPATGVHQYYTGRLTPDGHSTQDGGVVPFTGGDAAATRAYRVAFARRHGLPEEAAAMTKGTEPHWYVCMQKPFKRQPEFDAMLAGVLSTDPSAQIILHAFDPMRDGDPTGIFRGRLVKAGADLARIHLVPALPHHELLALYAAGDVILDSYPAGGCTTTREALELGKAVVTLPARLLGTRWTAAYLRIMDGGDGENGGEDNTTTQKTTKKKKKKTKKKKKKKAEASLASLQEVLVAKDKEDYVRLAVALGTDAALRKKVQERIQERLPRLFKQDSAVKSWTKMLLRINRGGGGGAAEEEGEEGAGGQFCEVAAAA